MNDMIKEKLGILTDSVSLESIKTHLKEMIAIPSVNPMDSAPRPGYREKEIAEYYLDQMNQLGMDVSSRDVTPGRPNVLGVVHGTNAGASLMLCGHLDTVPAEVYDDPYNAREADGRIYGRGSCDMKAALACYLEVIRLVKESDLKLEGTLILCGVADEEWQMIGSRDIGQHGPFADHCIIGEPSSLAVCPAHKGQYGLFIRTFGKAVHSSIPDEGANAIERMAKIVTALSDYNNELSSREPHPLCGHGSYSPGVIRGGDIASVVPDFCELEIDRRLLPGDTIESVHNDIERILEALRIDDPGFRYELSKSSWNIPANDVSVDVPVVRSLINAAEVLTGAKSEASAFPGATDAPFLGSPTIICGPGNLTQAHSIDEYVEIEQLERATLMYLHAVCDLLI
ncbi:MAG: acetylornithine deacetylase [Acidiferrobacteraceae bacterium]|nr:acetylornithine deacetylase [Acidiferrobacteraceae bacterium]